jgi:hypothetical protein
VHPYTDTCVSGANCLENLGVGEAKRYSGFMIEATNNFRLHPTSISYVYKVFYHLDMLWMDIWVHPYTVILV